MNWWCPTVSGTVYIVNYFKEIKRFKSLQKAEAYSEPKRASAMELFCKYT